MRVLGVDVGGTSTRATVVAGDGRALGYGVAGSGNPTASGVESAAAAIVSASRAAMQQAGVAVEDVDVGVAGIAGAAGALGARLRAALADAALTTSFSFEGDLLATYWSGTLEPCGYVLVSGTGAVAARVVDGRLAAVRDGLGWLLGDRGSGFWIGRRVIRAVLAMLDHRRPPTVLADLVLADLGVDPSEDPWEHGRTLVLSETTDRLYQLRPADLARFAPIAFAAADAGDDYARQIVSDAVRELSVTILGVVEPDVVGPFVFGGSVLANRPAMVAGVEDGLCRAGLDPAVTTVDDGLVGAAVLALRRGGVDVGRAVHERIRTSLALLR
ncbi:N-acetylglucosamine kinase [Desertimonas flava]|uniref:N-acetylglucosamine kinase n=1 Tax=Desertimonas flava TaxID=2064846 RepID=UPI0013C3FF64|nr:BadF/BadG/BcrA/BcrD ATPase family protein [Desertimonas flava]